MLQQCQDSIVADKEVECLEKAKANFELNNQFLSAYGEVSFEKCILHLLPRRCKTLLRVS